MAKRNIARTAIEGGRAKHNRESEHEEDRAERRAYKNYCNIARFDPYVDEPGNWKMPHETGRAYRDFADKLSPVYRWLCKQVGRRWDDVYSEICERFENRSLAGRHIIGHIKAWVNIHREPPIYWYYDGIAHRRNWWDFEIDDDGIMTCGEPPKYFRRQVRCEEKK